MANGLCVSNVILMDLLSPVTSLYSLLCHHPACTQPIALPCSVPSAAWKANQGGFADGFTCSGPALPALVSPHILWAVQTGICEQAELDKGMPGLVTMQEPHQLLMLPVLQHGS